MAILRGFPPSNTISSTTHIPDLFGEAVVVKTSEDGKVLLDSGEWAYQMYTKEDGLFPIPPVGAKISWAAFSNKKISEKISYEWK